MSRRIVIVGNGMAGSRLAEELRTRCADQIVVLGDEAHDAYNRVLLPHVLAGELDPDATRLRPEGWCAEQSITVRRGVRASVIDVDAQCVVCADGSTQPYDELILATGSSPFLPDIEGIGHPAVTALRTLEDCARVDSAVRAGARVVVLGGGLLGLEAARGLLSRGAAVTVVHPHPHPMERQMDADGGAVLARLLAEMGVELVLGRRAAAFTGTHVVLDDGAELPADLVVVSAGVRPRAELAAASGIEVRRGVVVDDELRTSAPHVWAIGECAEHRGQVSGLVQPGWDQAAVVADLISGADPKATYEGTPTITRLKARGIDLTSMGEVGADLHDADHEVLTLADPRRGSYAKLVVRSGRIVGALLLGRPDAAGEVSQLFDTQRRIPEDRLALLTGRVGAATQKAASPGTLPDSAVLCRCNSVTKGQVVAAWQAGARTTGAIAERTRATTGCGGCAGEVAGLCAWLGEKSAAEGAVVAHGAA
ncbi:FAD-dependent oxidoreductase [Tomitella biformata]|uniref:FAD-dependent oxidoreductase n=1 Tax=Tomitella biformata TaxID=630403 RepID=UPI000466E1A3|nr:FAD-dependent oxidoreductase [Tomitella biformata]